MTKGLHICRHLHRAGWRVVLVDYDRWWMQGSRLSSCCAEFLTVPDPEQDSVGKLKTRAWRPQQCFPVTMIYILDLLRSDMPTIIRSYGGSKPCQSAVSAVCVITKALSV